MRARLFPTMVRPLRRARHCPRPPGQPVVTVHPGMETGSGSCAPRLVDPAARVAFTAGHCAGKGRSHRPVRNVVAR
jgi:hypothetical protein